MQDIRIDGKGNIAGGVFGKVKISGMGQCEGDLRAQSLEISGKFKCGGSLTADILECSGMAQFATFVHAKRMKVSGMLAVDGESRIEAEEIRCSGCIRLNNQISADKIEVSGSVFASEIVGDQVTIKSYTNRLTKLFTFPRHISRVDLIEATTVELCGVNAQTVNGSSVVIGPDCEIDALDCNGTLSIDSTSHVKSITGNYVMV